LRGIRPSRPFIPVSIAIVAGLLSVVIPASQGSVIAAPAVANGSIEIDTKAPGKTILGTLTITGAQADGFAAVYPCASGWAGTSNINYRRNVDIANFVAVPSDAFGKICVLTSQTTDVVFDQTGEVDLASSTPVRVIDTRQSTKVAANGIVTLRVGVPGRTLIGNVTATDSDAGGFIALYPCATGWSGTSNINFSTGQTIANAFVTRVDANGEICVRSSAKTHIVLDRFGELNLDAANSIRLLDSRGGAKTVPNKLVGIATGQPNRTFIGNLTVTGQTGAGFGTVVPCPVGWPSNTGFVATTSNINFNQSDVGALFVSTTNASGYLCVATSVSAHVIVDQIALPIFGVHASQRVLDTRANSPAPPDSVPIIGGCQMFPADNPWNQRIDTLPLNGQSATWVGNIGSARFLHPDFGGPYGIPFSVVPATQPMLPINFTAYGDESDPGPYPIPLTSPIEGGSASDGDRHVLVLQSGICKLFELYRAFPQSTGWNADAGATFDLKSNALRPDSWTSTDAAGLPVTAGLVRYEDIAAGALRHAVRFTVQCTQRGYIHPATHQAGVSNAACPPMGARFRMKAAFDTSRFTGQTKIILEGLKHYGMIVADNGSNWFITGSQDSRWDATDLEQLKSVPGSAFEVVETGPILR
jgi:hypothetical protein